MNAKPFVIPKQPPLPKERVTQSLPFTYTGVNFFGPVWVKENNKDIKMWSCIFVCMTVRCIHLEVAESLLIESFLNCFKRFVTRRGYPQKMFSDNKTNFIACQKTIIKKKHVINNFKKTTQTYKIITKHKISVGH